MLSPFWLAKLTVAEEAELTVTKEAELTVTKEAELTVTKQAKEAKLGFASCAAKQSCWSQQAPWFWFC